MYKLQVKRIYEPKLKEDGFRVLVDRLWPRGVSKEAAGVDLWLKDIAPSTELRRWFGHDPEKWKQFCRRYEAELRDNPEVAALLERARGDTVTLVYAAADTEHNQAVVLRDFLIARQQSR